MKRLRLLVLLFTVLAVAFTGMSTASADERRGGNDDEATIIRISDAKGDGNRSRELSIKVKYECESDNERGRLTVTLTQKRDDKKVKYEGDARATCDGEKYEKKVKLHRVSDGRKYARDGRADVKVTLRAGDDTDRKDKKVHVDV
jgi:hypothetical protein